MQLLTKLRELLSEYKLSECEALCREALKEDKNSIPLQALLSSALLLQAPLNPEAKTILDSIDQKSEDLDPKTLADLGGAWLLWGDIGAAEQLLQLAVQKDATLYIAYSRLALLYTNSDRMEQAQEAIDKALQTQDQKQKAKYLHIKSNLELAQNNYEEAEALLKEALEMDEDNIFISKALCHLYSLKARHLESLVVYNRLLENYPEDLECRFGQIGLLLEIKNFKKAKRMLGEIKEYIDSENMPFEESQRLNFEAKLIGESDSAKAKELYKQALESFPKNIQSMQGLGHLYLLEGETKEAVAMFYKVEEIAPMAGFSSLASAKEFPKDEQTLQMLENAVSAPLLNPGTNKAALLFALATARESKKEYQKAFELVLKANSEEKKFLDYSKDAHRKSIQDIMQRYTKEFFQKREAYGNESKLPIFVLGMPRSGTTLVEQMLGCHKNIFAAGELGLVPAQIQNIKRWDQHTGSEKGYPLCMDELTQEMIQNKTASHIEELQKLALEDERDISQITRIVDKLPHNFENIGLIKLLFPNAKIIHCRRDPHAIALSNFFQNFQAKHGGMGFAYDLEDIGHHIADHHKLMEYWHTVFPDQILELPYEKMVEEPKEYAQTLLEYLELEWDDAVLEHTKLKRNVKTASVWQVRQPVYTTSKEKWHNYKEELQPFTKAFNEGLNEWELIELETFSNEEDSSLFNQALEHHRKNQFYQAEQGYRKVLSQNPNHSGALYLLGLLGCISGHYEVSLALLEKVKEKYNKLPAYHYNLALVYKGLHKEDLAIDSAKKALKLNPKFEDAKNMLEKLNN